MGQRDAGCVQSWEPWPWVWHVTYSVLLILTAAADAKAEPPRSLGSLEREAVETALAEVGRQVEPAPDGKVIRQILVVNHDVFSRQDWYFQALNVLHRTTRPDIIVRELLLSPGQTWDERIADESVRNLQAPPALFFSDGTVGGSPQVTGIVAIVPVTSPIPGTVDVLAVTRDLWSLRFNTEFSFQRNRLALLRAAISENNLFGWHKQLAAAFELDQGRVGIGPTYFDPNILGTRLTLLAKGTAWFARDSGNYEGNNETFSIRYPLYALSRRWAAGVDVSQQDWS